jgi:1-acyl-sn-glycerol-3-phosphate acyltransferase
MPVCSFDDGGNNASHVALDNNSSSQLFSSIADVDNAHTDDAGGGTATTNTTNTANTTAANEDGWSDLFAYRDAQLAHMATTTNNPFDSVWLLLFPDVFWATRLHTRRRLAAAASNASLFAFPQQPRMNTRVCDELDDARVVDNNDDDDDDDGGGGGGGDGGSGRVPRRRRTPESARHILASMMSLPSTCVVRLFGYVLTKVFRRLFRRMRVDVRGIQQLAAVARRQRVSLILLPTHRSYFDFLIMSYVCFTYALPMPLICAGDNLRIPVVGPLLRRAGAFFIRRRFGADALYARVFRAHVSSLVHGSKCTEFFVEGGRTRTGAVAAAKYGMLSAALAAAGDGAAGGVTGTTGTACNDADATHDFPSVWLVPVSIAYDCVVEASDYSQMLLGGRKRDESLFALLASCLNIRCHGDVHIRFAAPIPVDRFQPRLTASLSAVSLATSPNAGAATVTAPLAPSLTLSPHRARQRSSVNSGAKAPSLPPSVQSLALLSRRAPPLSHYGSHVVAAGDVVVATLEANSAIPPTALLALVLLHPSSLLSTLPSSPSSSPPSSTSSSSSQLGVTVSELAERVKAARALLVRRGCRVTCAAADVRAEVVRALALLKPCIHTTRVDSRTSDTLGGEERHHAGDSARARLQLRFYANQATHVLIVDAIVVLAFALAGDVSSESGGDDEIDDTGGVHVNSIAAYALILANVLAPEFPSQKAALSDAGLRAAVADMLRRRILLHCNAVVGDANAAAARGDETRVRLSPAHAAHTTFLASLLRPYVFTYATVLRSLVSASAVAVAKDEGAKAELDRAAFTSHLLSEFTSNEYKIYGQTVPPLSSGLTDAFHRLAITNALVTFDRMRFFVDDSTSLLKSSGGSIQLSPRYASKINDLLAFLSLSLRRDDVTAS